MRRQLAWPEFREVSRFRPKDPRSGRKEDVRKRWQGDSPCLLFVQKLGRPNGRLPPPPSAPTDCFTGSCDYAALRPGPPGGQGGR